MASELIETVRVSLYCRLIADPCIHINAKHSFKITTIKFVQQRLGICASGFTGCQVILSSLSHTKIAEFSADDVLSMA